MDPILPQPASPQTSSQGEPLAGGARKRGPKAQPLRMHVTYVGAEGWDYKRAIYPMLREWNMFELSDLRK